MQADVRYFFGVMDDNSHNNNDGNDDDDDDLAIGRWVYFLNVDSVHQIMAHLRNERTFEMCVLGRAYVRMAHWLIETQPFLLDFVCGYKT